MSSTIRLSRRANSMDSKRLSLSLLSIFFCASASYAQDDWPMKGHDVRRTGQSGSHGIVSIDASRSWATSVPFAFELNIGASVVDNHVVFGSWGLLRKDEQGRDVRYWDKSDGKVYSLSPHDGSWNWGGPVALDKVHRCYDMPQREYTSTDFLFCGLFNNYHVTFYNGTVEGQPAFSRAANLWYVGRGDGRLFAIDPETGNIRWRFQTYNPAQPDDPDGGGEIVTAPLPLTEGVAFGTWAEGPYETNAFYAVGADSVLRWRYPADSSLPNRFYASPALSPDGQTIYAATFLGDSSASVLALNSSLDSTLTDAARLRWQRKLEYNDARVFAVTMTVASNGNIYIGGLYQKGILNVPIVIALDDAGEILWTLDETALDDGAQFLHGLAIREVDDRSIRLIATTGNFGTPAFNKLESGRLYAIDIETGSVLYEFDPSDVINDAVGGLNSPAISKEGFVYFGVRGRYGSDARNGYYFGVRDTGTEFEPMWHYEVDGHLEWTHPAIGPDGSIFGGSGVQDETLNTITYEYSDEPEGTSPLFYGIKGTTSVGIEQVSERPTPTVLLYPNPAENVLVVETSGIVFDRTVDPTVSVFDATGRLVKTSAAQAKILRIDIDDLPTGVYFLVLANPTRTGQIARAFVVRR